MLICLCNFITSHTDQEFVKALGTRPESSLAFPIKDIYNGKEYRKHGPFLSKVANPANISLLLNTDGVAMFKSSCKDIWPIYLAINELPPAMRYV